VRTFSLLSNGLLAIIRLILVQYPARIFAKAPNVGALEFLEDGIFNGWYV